MGCEWQAWQAAVLAFDRNLALSEGLGVFLQDGRGFVGLQSVRGVG